MLWMISGLDGPNGLKTAYRSVRSVAEVATHAALVAVSTIVQSGLHTCDLEVRRSQS